MFFCLASILKVKTALHHSVTVGLPNSNSWCCIGASIVVRPKVCPLHPLRRHACCCSPREAQRSRWQGCGNPLLVSSLPPPFHTSAPAAVLPAYHSICITDACSGCLLWFCPGSDLVLTRVSLLLSTALIRSATSEQSHVSSVLH